MIASISKGSNYKRLIEYHDQKCKEGRASLLFDGTFSQNSDVKELTSAFKEHFAGFSNDKSVKNKIAHISLSLPKGEKLNDDNFKNLSRDYMDQMGYKNCPYLIFRHHDKDHEHVHILVATVDYEGKKVKDFKDFKRSQEISRQLEKKYSLKNTEYSTGTKSQTLTELNYRRYYMHNALRKASLAYNSKHYIDNFFSSSEKKMLFSKRNFTQKDIYFLLGKERFDRLYSYLQKQGYFKPLFKDELSKKLDPILSNSRSFKEFIEACNREGIYIRKMTDKNRLPYLKYGLIADNFYIKDTNLSARFRYNKIKEKFGLEDDSYKNQEKNTQVLMDYKAEESKEEKKEKNSQVQDNNKNEPKLIPPSILDNNKGHFEEYVDLAGKRRKKRKRLFRS